jgi:hypothetical protein
MVVTNKDGFVTGGFIAIPAPFNVFALATVVNTAPFFCVVFWTAIVLLFATTTVLCF